MRTNILAATKAPYGRGATGRAAVTGYAVLRPERKSFAASLHLTFHNGRKQGRVVRSPGIRVQKARKRCE